MNKLPRQSDNQTNFGYIDDISSIFFKCFSLVFILVLSGCTNLSKNSNEADARIATEGFVKIVPDPGNPSHSDIVFGPTLLGTTQLETTADNCTGAVGSILPPLAFRECLNTIVDVPFRALDTVFRAISRKPDSRERHVSIDKIDQYWVGQSHPEDCWAAALQTGRDYLGLHHLTQEDILFVAHQQCPATPHGRHGIDKFQLLYMLRVLRSSYDNNATHLDVCDNSECIINTLMDHHPLLLLNGEHAVLIVGARYLDDPELEKNGLWSPLKELDILDPNPGTDGKIIVKSRSILCTADLVIAL